MDKRGTNEAIFDENEMLTQVGQYGELLAQGKHHEINAANKEKPKQKNTKGGTDYASNFLMVKRVAKNNNVSITINQDFHTKMLKITAMMGEDRININTYLNNIVAVHFEQYRDVINELYKEGYSAKIIE